MYPFRPGFCLQCAKVFVPACTVVQYRGTIRVPNWRVQIILYHYYPPICYRDSKLKIQWVFNAKMYQIFPFNKMLDLNLCFHAESFWKSWKLMGAIAPVAPALKLHLQRVEEHSNIHERPDSILLPSFLWSNIHWWISVGTTRIAHCDRVNYFMQKYKSLLKRINLFLFPNVLFLIFLMRPIA